jgi:hypothetical protein
MSTLTQELKTKYLKKYREEKLSATKARQVRIINWIENEKMYNGVPTMTLLTRSNLHIPKMFESIQTTSSKIGNLPEVEYEIKPEGSENAVEIMKALYDEDMKASDGAQMFQNSKIEAGLYGRAVYKIIPSNDGAKFELVDTMSYLVAPTAKNTKDAIYQGQQFIYKTLEQLEADAEEFYYDMDEVKKLKDNHILSETEANFSQEKSLKDLRLSYLGYANVQQLGAKMAEITEWYTMIKKELYVMTVANDEFLLRCVPIKEIGLTRSPFVSWGVYPRGVAFWTPGVADVVRDPNLAMDVAINQLIDNNTYRNFGMMFVSSSSGLKQSSISPRPLGITPVNVGLDKSVKDSVWQYTPPEISSATNTLHTLNSIAENSAGLSAIPLGSRGKMSVTQQSQLQGMVEAKNNLIKQNAVRGIEELAQMYAEIISNHLTSPRKVKVYGYKPLTIDAITKKNFKDVEFIAKAESPETSHENRAIKQKSLATLYELFKDDPKVPGQIFLRERLAKEFDISPTDIDKMFTQEQKLEETAQAPQPQPQQGGQVEQMPTNPASPLLSQTGAAAQAQVPPAIR